MKDSIHKLLLTLVATSLLSCAPPPPLLRPMTPSNYNAMLKRDLTDSEKAGVARAVSQGLKDPESARFKWGQARIKEGQSASTYCGLVNGKNSYGGYTGDQAYMVVLLKRGDGGDGAVLIDIGDINQTTCATEGYFPDYFIETAMETAAPYPPPSPTGAPAAGPAPSP